MHLISSSVANCDGEIIVGGDAMISSVAMVNTLVPACFICLDLNDTSTVAPRFSINNVPIQLKAGVKQSMHILFVTNFTNLPLLMNGVNNRFECVDAESTYFSRTVTTLGKE